jgi:hypothetical protein
MRSNLGEGDPCGVLSAVRPVFSRVGLRETPGPPPGPPPVHPLDRPDPAGDTRLESAARPNLPDLEPGRANLVDATLPPLQLDTYPGTCWKEGALIGAIAIGVVGFLIANRICGDSHDSDHCSTERFGGAAIGTGVGFGLGALVGSRFRKGP